MPKRLGQVVCSLAITSLMFSFVGCRTTATKLASVPGLGWLDRDEEGWAGYEPAPNLPRPSSTSEPTSTGGNSAANIASNSPSTSSTKFPLGGRSDAALANRGPSNTKPRFDTSRYVPGSSSSNLGVKNNATSVDYASAYGKYGPPKPLGTKTNDPLKPQQGPYREDSTAKYAASGLSVSTKGYTSLGDSRFGSSSSTLNDTNGAASDAAAYSTGRSSRLAQIDSLRDSKWDGGTKTASTSSTYTPPGFIRKPTPPSEFASSTPKTSRFDAVASPGVTVPSSAQHRAMQYMASAQNSLSSSAERASSRTDDVVNQSATSANQEANSYLRGAQNQLGATSSAMNSQPGEMVNNFTTSATNTAGGYLAAAQQHLNRVAPAANTPSNPNTGLTSRFDRTVPLTNTPYQQAVNQFANSESVTSANQSAHSHLEAAKHGVSNEQEAVTDYVSAASDAGRNTMRNVSGPGQPSYPTTSTPHGYFDRPTNLSVPATSTPPKSTIRRSPAPFRPGSTSTFQSSTGRTSYYKQELQTSATGHLLDDHLVLAVGDKYQFPRTLR